MNVIFVGGLYPKEICENIVQNSKGMVLNSANTFQWATILGLNQQLENFKVLSAPFIGSYPFNSKQVRLKSQKFGNSDCIDGKCVGFTNIIGLKYNSIFFNLKKELNKWYDKSKGKNVIIIYSLTPSYVKASIELKKIFPNVRICVIVPDLLEDKFLSYDKISVWHEILLKKELNIINECYPFIDSFVLITKYMKDKLPLEGKSYTVVEGIYQDKQADYESKNCKNWNILYTGNLGRCFGILHLINAFKNIKNPKLRLIICGIGDTEKEIKAEAKKDSRIIYKGQVKREEVIQLQNDAFLLVNPRTPSNDFTKYSFPSKTMEYLASGTPTLLYKLPGIPDEYYNHCYSLENLSEEALAKKIEEITNLPGSVLEKEGADAREFIVKEKNAIKQTEKIIDLINKL